MLCLAGAVPVSADPAELQELRAAFDQKVKETSAGLEQLNAQYVAALERLKASDTKKGNLEAVLEAENEIKAFAGGTDLDRKTYRARQTNHPGIDQLRETYLIASDEVILAKNQATVDLITAYGAKLKEMEVNFTKAGRIDDALTAKNERQRVGKWALELSPKKPESAKSNAPPEEEAVSAKLYLVAKAEAEVYHNGEKVRLRDRGNEGDGGTNGESALLDIKPGDSFVVRSKSVAVYRSVAMALELTKTKKIIHFPASRFRILGVGDSIEPEKIDAKTILSKSDVNPPPTIPDDYWVKAWEAYDLGGGEFAKPSVQGKWEVWGTVLEKRQFK